MSKTLVPAFQCSVGDWKYYIAMMKYAEVKNHVSFAHELRSSATTELGQLFQRGLTKRAEEITKYLLTSQSRFLGAIVIAAYGGDPQYAAIEMETAEGMLRGLDRGFGVLVFDGSQSYFALDGQHRLRAIIDAVKANPKLGSEDLCVLIVTHLDTPEGRKRTRRLFTNINRNAVKTAKAEDIVLDEDDGFAVLTRQLLEEHAALKVNGRVKVIVSQGADGELKLAGNSISKSDKKAMTTLPVLYDIGQYLGYDFPGSVRERKARPSDSDLEACYKTLSRRLEEFLHAAGDLLKRLDDAPTAVEVRGIKGKEGAGHPMMRPVIQKAVARAVKEILQQGQLDWPTVMKRLSKLDWQLSKGPWCAVFNPQNRAMISAKANSELLCKLLHAHLAPASARFIKDARREYKEIRNEQYPVSEQLLEKGLVGVSNPRHEAVIDSVQELSSDADLEALDSE